MSHPFVVSYDDIMCLIMNCYLQTTYKKIDSLFYNQYIAIDNSDVHFGNKVFRQLQWVFVGTKYAPVIADLFLSRYEYQCTFVWLNFKKTLWRTHWLVYSTIIADK